MAQFSNGHNVVYNFGLSERKSRSSVECSGSQLRLEATERYGDLGDTAEPRSLFQLLFFGLLLLCRQIRVSTVQRIVTGRLVVKRFFLQ